MSKILIHYANSKLEILCGTPVASSGFNKPKPYTRDWRQVECSNCLSRLFGRSKWNKKKPGPLAKEHLRELNLLSERDLVCP